MTLEEILKSQGLEEDTVKKIIGEMKQNKIYTASEENLDIRFGKLKTDHESLVQQNTEAQNLIKQLQESTKRQEDVQKQITDYQNKVTGLEAELAKTKTESAIKIALLGAGAKESDLDYLMYKTENGDWKPELDKDGNVKGLDDKIKGMKTQYPAQFEASSQKKFEEHKLPDPEDDKKISKDDFNKMGYQERLKLFNESPDVYNELTKGK